MAINKLYVVALTKYNDITSYDCIQLIGSLYLFTFHFVGKSSVSANTFHAIFTMNCIGDNNGFVDIT